MTRAARSHVLAAFAGAALIGCPPGGGDGARPTPSASVSSSASAAPLKASAGSFATTAPSASAAPVPYKGPSGTVRGTVTLGKGEPPKIDHVYPKGCESAVAMYGRLFRVGQDKGIADVVVTVTHYEGFVPPKSEVVPIAIKDCAFDKRVYTMTNGQHIEVSNLDVMRSYVPHLEGARAAADLVAIPRGPAVKLYSRGLSRYFLGDQMGRTFMKGDVFHFRFSTAAVTGLDGKYAIDAVPVGKAKVGILWPAANMKTMTKDVEIKEGDGVAIDFSLEFDAKKDTPPATKEAASAAQSASARPL